MEVETGTGTPSNCLYYTLPPLSLPADGDFDDSLTTTTPQSPPHEEQSDGSEPYVVYRSEISLTELQFPVYEDGVVDYFSLDVGSDAVEAPIEEPEPRTPVRGMETAGASSKPAMALESGWFGGNRKFRSPMIQLHKEIVDFCEFLSPTQEEQESRNAAVDSVTETVKYIWPNCQVAVFGSFNTGLYLPTSDIDVVIMGSGVKKPQLGLHALSRALSLKGIAKKILVIAKARVPIIKFVEKRSGVAFDISFDIENGPKAATFIKDAVSRLPPLRPLCLILKVFLQQRELNEVYSGGIGSYALLTMLMAMLRNVRASQPLPEHNLGVLLVHFFEFYGRQLNTPKVGISCRSDGTFYSKISRGFYNADRPALISIEDPQAPDNDLGKNSYNYFQVRSAFAMAFSTLTNPMIINSLGPNRSILGTIIRPDPVLLERKGGLKGEMTFDSLLPGAGESVLKNHGNPPNLFGNWLIDNDEDSLPRGGATPGTGGSENSRKRKASSRKKKKNLKEEDDKVRHGEEDDKKTKERSKKKRHRHRSGSENVGGHRHAKGSPWKRS
ncbi:hypothetical protein MLD38_035204 [Melastoma candidum]|uniref:Uncharacterized protein n=1 Tax=Melastoma candidum TaxID=119954 RepID=A0ACB9MCV7_9MYRT|nr:hypothetical protein MLD38_035204 [Melastoma candidum]